MHLELAERVAALAPTDGLHGTSLPRVAIHRRTAPSGLGPRVLAPGLGVILGGEKRFTREGQSYAYGETDWLVTPHPVETICAITKASSTKPYLALVVSLDMALVAEAVSESADLGEGSSSADDDIAAPPLGRSQLDDTLGEVLLRLVRALASPRDARLVGPLVERELIHRLLQSDQRALVRRIGLRDRAVSEVLAAIETRYAERLSIGDLARSVHLGVSSLHHRFKAATGTSPLQFLKKVRLREARRLMIERRFDAASAAYAVGYASASQFSRDYARAYALPPRRDVARLSTS